MEIDAISERPALKPASLPKELIVQDIVELPSFSRARLVNGTQGLDRVVRSVKVLERVLPHLVHSGQLLLAMGDFVAGDAGVFAPIADKLSAGNIAALVFKRASFRADMLETIIKLAGDAGFAMVELPLETDWLEVCLECVGRLSATEVPLSPASVRPDAAEQTDGDGELQAIANTLSRALKTSVTISTPNNHLLAYSALGGPPDRFQQQIILDRRPPQSILDIVEREGLREILRNATRPFRLKGIPAMGLRPYIWGPIRAGGELLGVISVQENDRRLDRTDKVIVERAAAAAAWCILRGRLATEREQKLKKDLVSMLLAEEAQSHANLVGLASRLGYDVTTFRQALVIQADNLEQHFGRELSDEGPGVQYVGRRLRQIAAAELSSLGFAQLIVVFGRLVVVLFSEVRAFSEIGGAAGYESPLDAEAIGNRIRVKLQTEWPGLTASIGIGERVDNFLDLRRSYEQAKQAAWVSQKAYGGDRVLPFEAMGVYRLLAYQLAHQKDAENLRMLRNPAIERLIDYDRRENTELLRTLEVFLENVGHPKEIARQLFIHRSTLQYRLERIESVTGLSLNDAEDRLNLQIGVKLLKLMPR